MMFHNLLYMAMFLLSVSTLVALYRLIKGATASDRILALDAMSYNIIGIVTILSIALNTQNYLDVILLIGILAFLGTVALCKYVERGVVIEHERDN